MPTPPPALRKQLATGELKPVYLLAGEEHLLLLEAADALRARARELGYVEREVLDADANFDWNQLVQSASAMSLFATRKLIDLRIPTGKPGKEGSAAIIEYCENPPPDTVLLITATQWSKAHETSWVAAAEKAGVFVPLWPLKPNELPDWIAQRMAARGLKPTREAIEALAERIEGNLLAAAQEIDKLTLLQGDKPLDAATLEDLVADSARFDVFKLADAALAGDAARALRILAGLRAEGEQVVGLLGWLLNQLQLLTRLANARGNQAAAFKAERIWPAREAIYKKALSRAERRHWDACLIQAGRVDRIGKGRGAGDAWLELERLLVAIAQPRAGLLAKIG
ncbi:MAG: DNA polymerase III subunit delta [Proteobacteria bacterium]|uniref:DNA polymerase III subunit delta n=1 Tax=Rudaea sp. TaxID=2136325 RepID=UPI001E1729B4|nr:DNA polymerase III subunit delta [Pseudomonadota bacterium]MBS0568715.1 DNA polymerase III subunit delta [Pseudomonadota bacterium]